MELVVPELGNCTRVSFDLEFPCTATQFRQLKRRAGIDTDADGVGLLDLLPQKEALLKVDLHFRRGRKGALGVAVQVRHVRRLPEEASPEGEEVDARALWEGLAALASESGPLNADASFHYPRGSYELKDVDLEKSGAKVPKDEPVMLVDGVSLRFANFPNGLECMRIYTVGPLRRDKCLQVDVYHALDVAFGEDILDRIISMSRAAARMFVEEKGSPGDSAAHQ